MGSFLERHECRDMEDMCWAILDLAEELIRKIPEEQQKMYRKKVKIFSKLFNEESGLSWEEAERLLEEPK